jgi:hypothetical protein
MVRDQLGRDHAGKENTMNVTAHLEPLVAVTTIASVATVMLVLVLVGQLLRGKLRRALGSLAAIALLTAVGLGAAFPLANTPLIGVPPH